jgi:hypothetical protein
VGSLQPSSTIPSGFLAEGGCGKSDGRRDKRILVTIIGE